MRWIHISDLHMNPLTGEAGDGRSSLELREKLPVFINDNFLKKNIRVDKLFITGDFRHAFKQKDMPKEIAAKISAEYVLSIAKSAGVKKEHIHIVPGNHDLNREDDNNNNIEHMNVIFGNYSVDYGIFSSKINPKLNGKSDLNYLLDRFSFFRLLSKELFNNEEDWSYKLNPIHHYLCCGEYNLLFMNTAIACGTDNDRNRIIIGNYDLYNALSSIKKENPDAPIIVLAHHSPHLFSTDEFRTVERFMRENNIILYLCGDEHKIGYRVFGHTLVVTMGCILNSNNINTTFSSGVIDNCKIKSLTAYSYDNDFGIWAVNNHYQNEFDSVYKGYPINNYTDKNKCLKDTSTINILYLYSYPLQSGSDHIQNSELVKSLKAFFNVKLKYGIFDENANNNVFDNASKDQLIDNNDFIDYFDILIIENRLGHFFYDKNLKIETERFTSHIINSFISKGGIVIFLANESVQEKNVTVYNDFLADAGLPTYQTPSSDNEFSDIHINSSENISNSLIYGCEEKNIYAVSINSEYINRIDAMFQPVFQNISEIIVNSSIHISKFYKPLLYGNLKTKMLCCDDFWEGSKYHIFGGYNNLGKGISVLISGGICSDYTLAKGKSDSVQLIINLIYKLIESRK